MLQEIITPLLNCTSLQKSNSANSKVLDKLTAFEKETLCNRPFCPRPLFQQQPLFKRFLTFPETSIQSLCSFSNLYKHFFSFEMKKNLFKKRSEPTKARSNESRTLLMLFLRFGFFKTF